MDFNILEQKDVYIEVLTPVFIGTGEEYSAIEYILDDNNPNVLSIIDIKKFSDRLYKEDPEKFKKFIEISDKIIDLITFLKDNYTSNDILYEIYLDEYVYRDLSKTTENILRRPISKFIKDNNYIPFIPGSSIKGAIRTAIANYIYLHNKERIDSLFSQYYNKKIDTQKFESLIFQNNINLIDNVDDIKINVKKDFLKYLEVSDFYPINNSYTLKLVKPLNRGRTSMIKNTIPVVLEVIERGIFKGTITIYKNRITKTYEEMNGFVLNYNNVINALRDFYSTIKEREERLFQGVYIPEISNDYVLIKLGKLSGAGSKTIEEIRKIKIRRGKTEEEKPYQTTTWVYKIGDRELQLGWVSLFDDLNLLNERLEEFNKLNTHNKANKLEENSKNSFLDTKNLAQKVENKKETKYLEEESFKKIIEILKQTKKENFSSNYELVIQEKDINKQKEMAKALLEATKNIGNKWFKKKPKREEKLKELKRIVES